MIEPDAVRELALCQAEPETFGAQPWGTSSWVSVRLDRVDPQEFRELVTDAWRGVAPRRTVAAFDAGDP